MLPTASANAVSIRRGFPLAAAFAAFILVVSAISPRLLPYIMGMAGLFAIGNALRSKDSDPLDEAKSPEFLALIAFLIWCAATLFWASSVPSASERLAKIGPLIPLCWAAVALAPHRAMPLAANWMTGGFVVMAAIIALELAADFPITRSIHASPNKEPIYYLNKNAVILCLTAWPLAWMFWRRSRRTIAVSILLVALVPVSLMESQAAQLAAICLLVGAVPSLLLNRRWFQILTFFGLFAVLIATPFAAVAIYDWAAANIQDNPALAEASVLQRLEAWALLSRFIEERPLFGHGLEVTRELVFPDDRVFIGESSDTILHPHNFVIQIWLETGAAGIALAGTFIAALIGKISARTREERLLLFPLLVATLAVMFVGWGLWQGWWIGFAAFLAFLCRTVMANTADER